MTHAFHGRVIDSSDVRGRLAEHEQILNNNFIRAKYKTPCRTREETCSKKELHINPKPVKIGVLMKLSGHNPTRERHVQRSQTMFGQTMHQSKTASNTGLCKDSLRLTRGGCMAVPQLLG